MRAGRRHEVYFESRHFDTADFIADAFRNDLQVAGGVLAVECAALYAKPGDAIAADDDPAHGRSTQT